MAADTPPPGIDLVHILVEPDGECVEGCPHPSHFPPPPLLAIAVTVSQAEQDHIDAIRRASIEHAVARGHLRRG